MVKKAELEINGKMIETVKRLEDPVQRQRNLVEQERQKYLNEEERIVKKLWWVEKLLEFVASDYLFFFFFPHRVLIFTLSSVKQHLCRLL